jgi:hypothetical protein
MRGYFMPCLMCQFPYAVFHMPYEIRHMEIELTEKLLSFRL